MPEGAVSHRLDGRGLVDGALVVDEQRGAAFGHREALARRSVGVEYARFTALDVVPFQEEHRDEVDPIPVSPFWSWAPYAPFGRDANRVSFDEPGPSVVAQEFGAPREPEQECGPNGFAQKAVRERLEPALDAAVESVEVNGLPMRSVGHGRNLTRIDRERAVPSTPIPPTTQEVLVEREARPMAREWPDGIVRIDAAANEGRETFGGERRVSLLSQELVDVTWVGVGGRK